MAVKYTIPYISHLDEHWRVDISNEAYTGDAIQLRTAEGQACTITYNNQDDPYQTIVNSKAEITVIKHDAGLIDIRELQEAQDREFIIEVYRENILYWKGFLVPHGIQEVFQSMPFDVQITAVDGLKMLDGISFNVTSNYAMPEGMNKRCPLGYVRDVLFANKLGLPLPIRWTNELECLSFPGEDSFAGSVVWSARGEGFTDFNGNYKSCEYVLEGLLKSHQMRIYQSEGRWVLERINDIVSGTYNWTEIDTVYDAVTPPNVTTGTINSIKAIGTDYKFINEDAILTVNPGLKGVKTTYRQNQAENILPNGNQDLTSTGIPLYWSVDNGSMLSVDSITSRDGSATEIDATLESSYIRFTLSNQTALPIDTFLLFKSCSIGFIYTLTSAPVDGDGNIISGDFPWPLMFTVEMNIGSDRYNLNQFGSWELMALSQTLLLPANPRNTPTKLNDIVSIRYDSSATADRVLLPQFPTELQKDDVCDIKVRFTLDSGCKAILDEIYIHVDENSDVYESTLPASKYTVIEESELEISSSFNGFFLSNLMTSWDQSDSEFEFTDGKSTGSLTKINSEAIMRFRNKPSTIFNGSIYDSGWSYGEIYSIQTLDNKLFMPLQARYNTELNEISLVAIECRDDDITLETIHYGSNELPLSN